VSRIQKLFQNTLDSVATIAHRHYEQTQTQKKLRASN